MLAASAPWASARAAEAQACIPPLSYLPLTVALAGAGDDGVAALGTYERISPDGRFVLRSYSGARLGQVSLIELPVDAEAPLKAYRTPLSNEAFPVQGSWRYLVDVDGRHFRFADVLQQQDKARPLFRAGMTGFYAAASELPAGSDAEGTRFFIRSLSWPQGTDPDTQGVGPLQIQTVEVQDDGKHARVLRSTGAQYICARRQAVDGNVYALPMLSVDGAEFSAIPQAPARGQPSMRVYGLSAAPMNDTHACDMRADLGFSPGKAVFGYAPDAQQPAWLTYSDVGHVYVHDRRLGQSFRLDHTRHKVLASAFPGLTRDGRLIYGATWQDCDAAGAHCTAQAGYVVADPYQSRAWRAYWQQRGEPPPKACITRQEVQAERARFARERGLPAP